MHLQLGHKCGSYNKRQFLLMACFVLCLFFPCFISAKTQSSSLGSTQMRWVVLGERRIQVEWADTPSARERGLMFRKKLSRDQGMLFVFDQEQVLRFWMKNTLIPLSIAFINKQNKIIDIQDMDPNSDSLLLPSLYTSSGPALYALEMNQGWFKKNNIKIGDRLELSPVASSLKNKKIKK